MWSRGRPAESYNGQIAQVLVELGKLNTQVAVIQTTLDALPVADHEQRIRALERFRWLLAGAAAVTGAAAGIAVTLLTHVVR